MQLGRLYDSLWSPARAALLGGGCQPDARLAAEDDARRGISLIGRLEPAVLGAIGRFTDACRRLEPHQYFYPAAEIHLTVMSIITCLEGLTPADVDVEAYRELIREALASVKGFGIRFRGITASPACVMIQGFPQDEALETIRARLRQAFKASNLRHSIDARYAIQTAHSTVIRFARPLENPPRLIELLDRYRAHDFGPSRMTELQLVFNDWYHRRERCALLASFSLD